MNPEQRSFFKTRYRKSHTTPSLREFVKAFKTLQKHDVITLV
jgi:hypothetical protein